MKKTDKSKLMHRAEMIIVSEKAVDVDVTIVDAVFLLHTMVTCHQALEK